MRKLINYCMLLSLMILPSCAKDDDTPSPPPSYCDGENCFSFMRRFDNRCRTLLDPAGLAIFAKATYRARTDDGNVTLIFSVERVRDTGVRHDEVGPETRKAGLGDEVFLGCDTGRDTVNGVSNTKLLHFIVPKCSSSRLYQPGQVCASRPPAEQWPVDYRYPPLMSTPAATVAGRALAVDCKQHCTPGSETALCIVVDVPVSSMMTMELQGIDWSKSIRSLREELLDESRFPISSNRWKTLVGVDPSEFGRGADIELIEGFIQQDGSPTVLEFEFQDKSEKIEADMQVGRAVIGERIVAGDTIEWRPIQSTAPVITFPNNSNYEAILGGKLEQMYISNDRMVMGNGSMCLGVAY